MHYVDAGLQKVHLHSWCNWHWEKDNLPALQFLSINNIAMFSTHCRIHWERALLNFKIIYIYICVCVLVCLCLCVISHYLFAISSFLNITQSCSIQFNFLKFPWTLIFECPSFSVLSRKGGKRELNKHPYLGLVFRAVQYIPAGRVEEEGCLLCFFNITGCPDKSEVIHSRESGTFSPSTYTEWIQKKMKAQTDAGSMLSKWDEVTWDLSH